MGSATLRAGLALLALVVGIRAYASAPGMYPPEESSDKVPTVPASPYGRASFHNYQFYYDKNPPKGGSQAKAQFADPPAPAGDAANADPYLDDVNAKAAVLKSTTTALKIQKGTTTAPRKSPTAGPAPANSYDEKQESEPQAASDSYGSSEPTEPSNPYEQAAPAPHEAHARSVPNTLLDDKALPTWSSSAQNQPPGPAGFDPDTVRAPTRLGAKVPTVGTNAPHKPTSSSSSTSTSTPTSFSDENHEAQSRTFAGKNAPEDKLVALVSADASALPPLPAPTRATFGKKARESADVGRAGLADDETKDVVLEASANAKSLNSGEGASKPCCSCCDTQPVTRQTKVESTGETEEFAEAAIGENAPQTQNTAAGGEYSPQPQLLQPYAQQQAPAGQGSYAQPQPFQQYQQSYGAPQQSCGCAQPRPCCAPPAPCCAPPCCPPPPPLPCCPVPRLCCMQLPPICLPPPPPMACCTVSFKVPTIPICMRSCPVCPCRRRVHKSMRLKRSLTGGSCTPCSTAGQPYRMHRAKRQAGQLACINTSGLQSFLGAMQTQSSCSSCGASYGRSARVKRMGCQPCLGRKKRDVDEAHEEHRRAKRQGCAPCLSTLGLGRKKRSPGDGSGCQSCNNLSQLLGRFKRDANCTQCSGNEREKRQATQDCACASSSAGSSSSAAGPIPARMKRQVQVQPRMGPVRSPSKQRKLFEQPQCDESCCDFTQCDNTETKSRKTRKLHVN